MFLCRSIDIAPDHSNVRLTPDRNVQNFQEVKLIKQLHLESRGYNRTEKLDNDYKEPAK